MTTKPKRVGIYLRVSTDEQTVENQLRELEAVAQQRGWLIVEVFKDEGISGTKGRGSRPGFDALIKTATRRKLDLISAWSVDRLGRSLTDLLSFLEEIHGAGVDLYLHQQGVDTTTPAGKAMFQMMGVFAEFERAMIQQRVKAGLERAKTQGKQLGRPRLSEDIEELILEELTSGHSRREVARRCGVSLGTVVNVAKRFA